MKLNYINFLDDKIHKQSSFKLYFTLKLSVLLWSKICCFKGFRIFDIKLNGLDFGSIFWFINIFKNEYNSNLETRTELQLSFDKI